MLSIPRVLPAFTRVTALWVSRTSGWHSRNPLLFAAIMVAMLGLASTVGAYEPDSAEFFEQKNSSGTNQALLRMPLE